MQAPERCLDEIGGASAPRCNVSRTRRSNNLVDGIVGIPFGVPASHQLRSAVSTADGIPGKPETLPMSSYPPASSQPPGVQDLA
jgi:hypothetical protein